MIELHEFAAALNGALKAIEEARGAEQRLSDARKALVRVQDMHKEVVANSTKAIKESDAHVAAQKKAAAELQAKMQRERADHDKHMAQRKATGAAQIAEFDAAIGSRQEEIRKLNAAKDALNAEVAGLKAAFAESMAKL